MITKCKLIHPSKLPEVEQLLFYLQNRKEKAAPAPAPAPGSARAADTEAGDSLRPKSASMQRYSPIEVAGEGAGGEGEEEVANINELEDYIELLYEEVASKVRGSGLLLQLSRNPDNLEELSMNETLMGALSRVLREEWRASLELTTNIIYIFFCFSTFTQFHPVILQHKIGSQVLDILQYEVGRHAQWAADLARRHKAADSADTEAVSALAAKFSSFVAKQEQTLRVSIYLLLNLSEDIKVEEKMKRRGVAGLLVQLLARDNDELLILVISFLKKLSLYTENKEAMVASSVVEKLSPLLLSENTDLINATVRLLLNLSFDAAVRARWGQNSWVKNICFIKNIQDGEGWDVAAAGGAALRLGQPEPGVVRAVPPQHGGQGQGHVHLHRRHPRADAHHPPVRRGAGRPRDHGARHQPRRQQAERAADLRGERAAGADAARLLLPGPAHHQDDPQHLAARRRHQDTLHRVHRRHRGRGPPRRER